MKQKKLILSIISVVLVGTFLLQPANAFWGTVQTDSIAAFSKASEDSSDISFTSDDFTSHLSSGAKLSGIILDSLPDSTAGALKLDGRNLMEGEGISIEGLKRMVYSPNSNNSITTFSFTPVFSTSTDTGAETTVTISVGQEKNKPPTAEDVTAETYENVYIEIPLSATDPENDVVTYQILDTPKLGTAKISGNKAQYTPIEGKKGLDQFTYVAIDAKGNSSEPAKISVQIGKNSSKITYYDMQNNSAYLPALKLSQLGIMTGEKVGSSYFFHPDDVVTRNEFVTMTVQAANLDIDNNAVTTFADDDSIATWAKPYISAAESASLITGYRNENGEAVMRGDQPITLAEASVIVEKLLNLTPITQTASFVKDVPSWAETATAALCENNIINPDNQGKINPNQNLSKEDAAKILYASLDYIV